MTVTRDVEMGTCSRHFGTYYDTTASSWVALAAAQTPDQIYWHVDFIDALQTARFSTYGRGVWDFVIGPSVLFANGFES